MPATPLWSESDIEIAVIDELLHRPRDPLGSRSHAAAPGVYLVFYGGELDCYRPITGGIWPIYAGSASGLAERMRRHQLNLRNVRSIGVDDLWVACLPLESHAGALYAEALIIPRFRPVWNWNRMSGFGTQSLGRGRRHQRPHSWSVLHPGRRVGAGEPAEVAEDLAIGIGSYLDSTVPRGGGWPPLPHDCGQPPGAAER